MVCAGFNNELPPVSKRSSALVSNAPPRLRPRRKKGRDTSLIQRACKLNIYNSSASSVKEIEHISLNQRLLIGCFNISRRITEGKEDVERRNKETKSCPV